MAETLAQTVPRILKRRLRRFLEHARIGIESRRNDELHAARIQGKRLRYNVEFFASILGEEAEQALKLLAHIQSQLGTIADNAAFVRRYDELLDRLEPGDVRAEGLIALSKAATKAREAALEELFGLWEGAEKKPYPERLATSISAALGSLSPNDA